MATLDSILGVLRAAGEETRLRIMALLVRGELTVSELTQILGQSQPRVSRHLKILADAGLIERHREGAWMFYRVATAGNSVATRTALVAIVEELAQEGDRIIVRDHERFVQSRKARAAIAAQYFQENAAEWNQLRKLHLPDSNIEKQIVELVGDGPFELFVDLGTGTGRMLELFSGNYDQGVGYDLSHDMLAIARANLDKAKISNAQVRHGDLFSIPLDDACADIVCVHQVLHYLAEPDSAVREASRLLQPGGSLVIADFAPHDLEFLRDDHAHRRLGFTDDEVKSWCDSAGLDLDRIETLSPSAGAQSQLTVKIWRCKSPGRVKKLHSRNFAQTG